MNSNHPTRENHTLSQPNIQHRFVFVIRLANALAANGSISKFIAGTATFYMLVY
jgi:hypothetical protein